MKVKRKLFQQAGIALLMSFSSTALYAAGIATEQIGGSDISLSPSVGYATATLRVSGDNADVTGSFASGEQISMDLSSMADGSYYYELSLADEHVEGVASKDAVRQSGQFNITNGIASAYSDEVAEAEAEAEAESEATVAEALAEASFSAFSSETD